MKNGEIIKKIKHKNNDEMRARVCVCVDVGIGSAARLYVSVQRCSFSLSGDAASCSTAHHLVAAYTHIHGGGLKLSSSSFVGM